MDIRNWSIDRIMQLPDHCFGRRWLVGVVGVRSEIGPTFDISEAGLPEKMVIWNLAFWYTQVGEVFVQTSLSLGDQLPANDAAFAALDILFKDIGRVMAGIRMIEMMAAGGQYAFPMRKLVQTGGRRLVGRFYMGAMGAQTATAVLTISSIPTEVPEWLISGQGRGQY